MLFCLYKSLNTHSVLFEQWGAQCAQSPAESDCLSLNFIFSKLHVLYGETEPAAVTLKLTDKVRWL